MKDGQPGLGILKRQSPNLISRNLYDMERKETLVLYYGLCGTRWIKIWKEFWIFMKNGESKV